MNGYSDAITKPQWAVIIHAPVLGFLTFFVYSFLDKREAENVESIAAGAKFTETYHTYEEVYA